MNILQIPLTADHKSAMFFDGVIAEGKGNKLETYNDGELVYNDRLYVGAEIKNLIGIINDQDIEDEEIVDIHVDKFFAVLRNGEVYQDLIFCDYDEAIKCFEIFLNKI